ncbi:hypothetical protein P171DRAFT_85640 [Karstenula rhodostoma CBS 690.94]|uniref:Uncharacterized protein n=1 Tax=Karstenula rhodostoma CBS 690.94 TaxID=1392251 RepID=A0A9P4PBD8_9PLEO|nr:hypothetical protein P171DRAFT_85640 [Karstenula rhodostoma CBS 690.94]
MGRHLHCSYPHRGSPEAFNIYTATSLIRKAPKPTSSILATPIEYVLTVLPLYSYLLSQFMICAMFSFLVDVLVSVYPTTRVPFFSLEALPNSPHGILLSIVRLRAYASHGKTHTFFLKYCISWNLGISSQCTSVSGSIMVRSSVRDANTCYLLIAHVHPCIPVKQPNATGAWPYPDLFDHVLDQTSLLNRIGRFFAVPAVATTCLRRTKAIPNFIRSRHVQGMLLSSGWVLAASRTNAALPC